MFPKDETFGGRDGWTRMKEPEISVVMSTYVPSGAGGLWEAVQSVLAQTYQDFEFLICDDGSGEEGAALLKELAAVDRRIRLLRNRERMGLASSLNRCIGEARGNYLARMDDDDLCLPERFQVQLDYLERHPEAAFVGCNAKLMGQGRIWGSRHMPEKPVKRDFLKYSPYIHPTVMFRRSVFQGREGYRTDTVRGEDLELFMRLAGEGIQGVNLQEELFCYREERGSYQRRTVRSRLDEVRIRYRGYGRLGILFPAGWLCALRPLAAACVPPGMLYRFKSGSGVWKTGMVRDTVQAAGQETTQSTVLGYGTGDSTEHDAGEGKRKRGA